MANAPLGLFFYRHLQTSQVLVDFTTGLRDRSLIKQIPDITQRPNYLRKDLWRPFLIACNIRPEVCRGIRQAILQQAIQPPPTTNYLRNPVKLRKRLERDMIESRLFQFAESLKKIGDRRVQLGKEMGPVELWWEWFGWKEKFEAAGHEWPEFVTHKLLLLKRGRNFDEHIMQSLKQKLPSTN